MIDAGIPMPAASVLMPMPSYAYRLQIFALWPNVLAKIAKY
jgi:hypothetical protein